MGSGDIWTSQSPVEKITPEKNRIMKTSVIIAGLLLVLVAAHPVLDAALPVPWEPPVRPDEPKATSIRAKVSCPAVQLAQRQRVARPRSRKHALRDMATRSVYLLRRAKTHRQRNNCDRALPVFLYAQGRACAVVCGGGSDTSHSPALLRSSEVALSLLARARRRLAKLIKVHVGIASLEGCQGDTRKGGRILASSGAVRLPLLLLLLHRGRSPKAPSELRAEDSLAGVPLVGEAFCR